MSEHGDYSVNNKTPEQRLGPKITFTKITQILYAVMKADLMSPYDNTDITPAESLITDPAELTKRTRISSLAERKGLVFNPEDGPSLWYIRPDIQRETVAVWQKHQGKMGILSRDEHVLLGITIEEISHLLYRRRHQTLHDRPPNDVTVELVGAIDRFLTLQTMQERFFICNTSPVTDTVWVKRIPGRRRVSSRKSMERILSDNVFCQPIESRPNLKPHMIGHRLAVGIVSHFNQLGGGLREFALRLRTISDKEAIKSIFDLGLKIPFYNQDEYLYLLMQLTIMGFGSTKYLEDKSTK